MKQTKERKVLIVEDDRIEQHFLFDTIQKINRNAKFYFSSTAEQALHIAYETPIDIFILDIQLADGGNGIILARKLRKIPQYFDSPIIFETTFADKEVTVFRDVRCQTFIPKPLEAVNIVRAYQTAEKSILFHEVNQNAHNQKNQGFLRLTHKGLDHNYKLSDIVFFRSNRNYILVASYDRETHELDICTKRETLKNISCKLNEIGEGNFVRCHKGFIVNLQYIAQTNWREKYIKLKFSSSQKLNEKIWLGEPGESICIPIGNEYKENFQKEGL
jgi:DNA-binding LytR/AlgR family response regulator